MEEINVKRELIYEKAISLLNESNTLALSILDEDRYPKIYPMEKVSSENLNRVVFITKKDSNKVNLLNRNNQCCVEVHTEDDSVCLKGNIEIHEIDKQMKESLPYEYLQRLERRGSHKYCILIFNTIKADLYKDGEITTYFG